MKKLIAILSTITMITSLSLNVAALPNGTPNGTLRYDINNKAYAEYVDTLGDYIYREQEFLDFFNSDRDLTLRPKDIHIYKGFIVEFGNDEYRNFTTRDIEFEGGYLNNQELIDNYSVDEINEFLSSENLKSHITEEIIRDKKYYVMHNDDKSDENRIDTFFAMYQRFGAIPHMYDLVSSQTYFNEEISGDANGDNSLDVQDCAFIAKALANRKGDTLPESADYNKDEKKNVIDAMEIAKDLASNVE